jgi:hypothetical protein
MQAVTAHNCVLPRLHVSVKGEQKLTAIHTSSLSSVQFTTKFAYVFAGSCNRGAAWDPYTHTSAIAPFLEDAERQSKVIRQHKYSGVH